MRARCGVHAENPSANSGGRRIESLKTAWAALQTCVSKSKNKETMPRGGVGGPEKALSGLNTCVASGGAEIESQIPQAWGASL